MATFELGYFPNKFSPTDLLFRTDEKKLYVNAGTFDNVDFSEATTQVPAGTMLNGGWALASIPTGYIYCDGAAVSRITHADLFLAIGTRFGVGDGTLTFNLPDCRDKFIRGAGATDEAGGTGGSDNITLDVSQIPAHNHLYTKYITGIHQVGYLSNSVKVPISSSSSTESTGGDGSHENRPAFVETIVVIKV